MKKSKEKVVSLKQFEELKTELELLKNRIFIQKKKSMSLSDFYFSYTYWMDDTPSTRAITLEEKIDLIAEHFGITFDMKPKQDEQPILKLKTQKKVGRPRKV